MSDAFGQIDRVIAKTCLRLPHLGVFLQGLQQKVFKVDSHAFYAFGFRYRPDTAALSCDAFEQVRAVLLGIAAPALTRHAAFVCSISFPRQIFPFRLPALV